MATDNYIRTLSRYQIDELKILFFTTDILHIGRYDDTGDLVVEYHPNFSTDYKVEAKKISFNPPIVEILYKKLP